MFFISESGTAPPDHSNRRDSDNDAHYTANENTQNTGFITTPSAPKEPQARSEQRASLGAVDAHSSKNEPRPNLNTVEAHSSRSELIRKNLNGMEAHSSRAEPRENLKAMEANNSTSQSRANLNTMEAHSSRSDPRSYLDAIVTNSSRNAPRAKLNCMEVNSSRSEPRTDLNVIEAHSSRNESRTSLDNINISEGEPQANSTSMDAHISSTPLRPQSSSEVKTSKKNPGRPRASLAASEANSSKNKKRTSSETSQADITMHCDDDSLLDRKESLLKALDDDLSLSGELIDEVLAQRWSKILRKGLEDNDREKLIKEYAAPENCKFLKAPSLNEEVAAVVEFSARKRDSILEDKQNQLGLGITAIGRAITLHLNQGAKNELNFMKHINHGCRLLLDLHYTETKSRRHLFKNVLHRSEVFRNLNIQSLERDDTLYGSKITKMVKKQGIPTTPIHPRPSSSSYGDSSLPNRARNAIDLNQTRDGDSARYRRN